MHLAFILFRYFPYGGLQRDFLDILKACQRRGAKITVFAMSWEGEVPENIDLRLNPGKALTRPGRLRQFVSFVHKACKTEHFDRVVGFNRMPGLDDYFAADSCFAEKALNQRNFLYRLSPRARQFLDFERALFDGNSKTRIFFLSSLQQQQFAHHYPASNNGSLVLPPGVNADRRAGQNAAELRQGFRDEFQIPEDQIILLQVGSGFAVKGVERSLHAIASVPVQFRCRLRYFLVGQDRPDKYLQMAQRLGIASQIKVFSGRDDIPRFLQGADLLIHPAYSESAGLILLEAVVAGLPVLTTDTCGYAEHVSKADAGLICPSPFQQTELNTMLLQMLDSERKSKWRTNGINYGQTEALYKRTEAVVDLLISG